MRFVISMMRILKESQSHMVTDVLQLDYFAEKQEFK